MAVRLDEVKAKAAEAVAALRRESTVVAAFLFGSHIEGRADAYSDIDIGVFVRGAETWDMHRRAQAAVRVQQEVGDDIELHIFSADQLEHCEPASFAAYVLKRGVRVDDAAVGRVAEDKAKCRTRETDS